MRDLIKLEKIKKKIIKSQIEYLNSDNSYGHPNKEVLSTLEYSKIYITDIDGRILVKIENNKFKIYSIEEILEKFSPLAFLMR